MVNHLTKVSLDRDQWDELELLQRQAWIFRDEGNILDVRFFYMSPRMQSIGIKFIKWTDKLCNINRTNLILDEAKHLANKYYKIHRGQIRRKLESLAEEEFLLDPKLLVSSLKLKQLI